MSLENRTWEVDIDCLPHHETIVERISNNPPPLLELCKRKVYSTISNLAKDISDDNLSIYSDGLNIERYSEEENNNDLSNLEINFNGIDIDNDNSVRENTDNEVSNNDVNRNQVTNKLEDSNFQKLPRRNATMSRSNITKRKTERNKSYYVPADIIKEHFNYLPIFIQSELRRGPSSICENVQCRSPMFDFITYEFCLG